MTVDNARSGLLAAARLLLDSTRELELMAVEDRPRTADVHLLDVIQNSAFELSGEVAEGVAALKTADAQAAVASCHTHTNRFGEVLIRDLANPQRVRELVGLSRYGREAGLWAREVMQSITTCQRLLAVELQPALLACWIELVERPSGRQSDTPPTPVGRPTGVDHR